MNILILHPKPFMTNFYCKIIRSGINFDNFWHNGRKMLISILNRCLNCICKTTSVQVRYKHQLIKYMYLNLHINALNYSFIAWFQYILYFRLRENSIINDSWFLYAYLIFFRTTFKVDFVYHILHSLI